MPIFEKGKIEFKKNGKLMIEVEDMIKIYWE